MAYTFTTSGARVDFTTNPFTLTSACTLSLWVRPSASSSSAPSQYFLNNQRSGPNFGQLVWHPTGSGDGAVQYNMPFASGATPKTWQTSSGSIPNNVFTHVLVTDSNITNSTYNSVRIYINGVVASSAGGTGDGAGTADTLSGGVLVGGRSSAVDRNFNGRVAFPAIWNRVLNSSDITFLAAGASPELVPNGLLWAPPLTHQHYDRPGGKNGVLVAAPTVGSADPTSLEYYARPEGVTV